MTIYTLISFILGIIIAYLVFYLKYKNRNIINELRTNLREANKEVHRLNNEMEEYSQQNILLKNKMGEFLEKNDDLSKIVGELSKYYYHIKKASQKTEELTKFLQEPDPEIEKKMQNYINNSHDIEDKNYDKQKSFF